MSCILAPFTIGFIFRHGYHSSAFLMYSFKHINATMHIVNTASCGYVHSARHVVTAPHYTCAAREAFILFLCLV